MTDDRRERLARAEDAYFSGAHQHAVDLCEDLLRELDPTNVDDADLLVRGIHIRLCASELWWRNPAGPNDVPVSRLLKVAATAAEARGDAALQALVCHLRGKHQIASSSLVNALEDFTEAVRLARISGDATVELDALSELGHHTAGQDLHRAIAYLHEAEALLTTRPLRAGQLSYHVRAGRVNGFLGVAHFDAGDFDHGERYLREAVAHMDAAGIVDQYALMSNYLAQLLICAGRYPEGEQVLAAALARTGDGPKLSMPIGYNLALLGKLHLESGHPDKAEQPILAGWQHLQGTQHASVRPIVRNYLAELLSDRGYGKRDIVAAEELLVETAAECRRSGFQRSELAALSLRARLLAEKGDLDAAVPLSTEAAGRLDTAGALPALRSEEIYLIHYEVLTAAGRAVEATEALRKAKVILWDKAATIADPDRRRQFLTGVPVSIEIEEAARRSGSRLAT
jgi:tetratricopeptide (TPR) repeat protein